MLVAHLARAGQRQEPDHGLFQAICRVNRLDGEDKEYGYIIDYRDLFRSLEKSVHDYTSEAFDKYEKVRSEIKLASGDYIDLKMYEPAMRHLIDTYIRTEESEKVSAFDDLGLVSLIVERGTAAVDALPAGIASRPESVAETIENNLRRVIIDEHPINPKYYERMSELLDTLIKQRKDEAVEYKRYTLSFLISRVNNPIRLYLF